MESHQISCFDSNLDISSEKDSPFEQAVHPRVDSLEVEEKEGQVSNVRAYRPLKMKPRKVELNHSSAASVADNSSPVTWR
ncbi:hypothetical protein F3Y22_tig00110895pilonHSYRG00170 [Hibiscus syriacus]|uniref:Uncharacterized protein n=1 Tax=Hibiscus syriacus TaxID=106335 RepID=A0A6A2ZEQ8_HIBSY|nr:hypothetical protein F3Y22_tig00110895pilonHSYRG00170 [Hibiscus syriacus]